MQKRPTTTQRRHHVVPAAASHHRIVVVCDHHYRSIGARGAVDYCGRRGDWDPFLFHSILLMAGGGAVVVALSARRNGGKWAKFMRKFLWANDDADFDLGSVSVLLRFGVESRLPFHLADKSEGEVTPYIKPTTPHEVRTRISNIAQSKENLNKAQQNRQRTGKTIRTPLVNGMIPTKDGE
ncbi:hypothetical protein RP20_CCG019873 [Aedes albopictus]|nr:hypothetical protein RP20_CCG019873 [Aedes albopictus]